MGRRFGSRFTWVADFRVASLGLQILESIDLGGRFSRLFPDVADFGIGCLGFQILVVG